MKYIIIGMGNFGASLAQKLAEQGHEVIGADRNMAKVEAYKDKLSHTICLDSTDANAVAALPLRNTDVIIVAIGEDQGANILTTAILKNMNVIPRIISRATNMLHETILNAIGVDEIVHPEEETAERWAKKLSMKGVRNSFDLNGECSVMEVQIPLKYVGKTLKEIDLIKRHNLIVLSTIQKIQEKNGFGEWKTVDKISGVASHQTVLNKDETILIYGRNEDLEAFLDF